MKHFIFCLSLTVLSLLTTSEVPAQDKGNDAILKELADLRAEVKALKAKLTKLETAANKEKVVGVWDWQTEYVPWHYVSRSFPATFEFTKEGKIKTSEKIEGSYEVEGNLLKTNLAKKTVTWQIDQLDNQGLLLIEVTNDTRTMRRAWFKKK